MLATVTFADSLSRLRKETVFSSVKPTVTDSPKKKISGAVARLKVRISNLVRIGMRPKRWLRSFMAYLSPMERPAVKDRSGRDVRLRHSVSNEFSISSRAFPIPASAISSVISFAPNSRE